MWSLERNIIGVHAGSTVGLEMARASPSQVPGLVIGGRAHVLAYVRLTETLLRRVRTICQSSDGSRDAAHVYVVATLTQRITRNANRRGEEEGKNVAASGAQEAEKPKNLEPKSSGQSALHVGTLPQIELDPALVEQLRRALRVLPDEGLALDAVRDRKRVAETNQVAQQDAQQASDPKSPTLTAVGPALLYGRSAVTKTANSRSRVPLPPPSLQRGALDSASNTRRVLRQAVSGTVVGGTGTYVNETYGNGTVSGQIKALNLDNTH